MNMSDQTGRSKTQAIMLLQQRTKSSRIWSDRVQYWELVSSGKIIAELAIKFHCKEIIENPNYLADKLVSKEQFYVY